VLVWYDGPRRHGIVRVCMIRWT